MEGLDRYGLVLSCVSCRAVGCLGAISDGCLARQCCLAGGVSSVRGGVLTLLAITAIMK